MYGNIIISAHHLGYHNEMFYTLIINDSSDMSDSGDKQWHK